MVRLRNLEGFTWNMGTEPVLNPPLLTADLPGLGGRLKTVPEDFEVEEIPAYQPGGSGPFLYLWVEKRDLGAEYFLRQVARRLDISPDEVGAAGLKDRRAVTRQMISVPESVEDRLPALEGEGIRVLQVSRHTNKLKTGHLHGNRFRILIRDIDPAIPAQQRLTPIVRQLSEQGLPNFYGAQRFGQGGFTAQVGLALLRGEPIPADPSGRRHNPHNRFVRKFALSAAQSVMFNRYLARRMEEGLFRRVLAGDVMSKWPMGGLFVAEDVAAEQQRFDARAIVTTGPIFGRKTFPAKGEAALRETAILDEMGMTLSTFNGFGKLLQGTRRHNLVYVNDLAAAIEPEGVRLSFTLPAGSYATMLLREVMKTDPGDVDDA
jgi:tRNA pseudouridine13 synthase